jgi:hypothetical protein
MAEPHPSTEMSVRLWAILSELQERLLLEILAELNVLSIVDIHSGNYYGPGRG